MLQACTSATPDFFASPGLLSNNRTTTSARTNRNSKPTAPVLVPSIAETAGLSRFVYLVGHSQQRYVFSAIQKSQISLYSEAIFLALEGHGNDNIWVGDYADLIARLNVHSGQTPLRIHVHLLAEGIEARSRIVSDLSAANFH